MILVITSRLQSQIISVHLCAQKNHFLDSLCDFFQWVWGNFCIFKLMDYAIILLYTFTMFFFKFYINFVTLHPQFFHIWLCSKYPGLFMTWSKLICMFHGSPWRAFLPPLGLNFLESTTLQYNDSKAKLGWIK